MKTVISRLTRPYLGSALEYTLYKRSSGDGICFDLCVSCIEQDCTRSVYLEDLTRSKNAGIKLLLLFHEMSVDPCHACDVLEDLLPLEE